MNQRRLLVVLSILLAFAAGYSLGFRWTIALYARSALKRLADSEFYAATLSVAALERMEKGDIDGAKRVLATDLSAYVRSKAKEVPSSHEAVLLQQIQKTSEHSPMLKGDASETLRVSHTSESNQSLEPTAGRRDDTI